MHSVFIYTVSQFLMNWLSNEGNYLKGRQTYRLLHSTRGTLHCALQQLFQIALRLSTRSLLSLPFHFARSFFTSRSILLSISHQDTLISSLFAFYHPSVSFGCSLLCSAGGKHRKYSSVMVTLWTFLLCSVYQMNLLS